MATFWATFSKTWATFYSNIWSHWILLKNDHKFIFLAKKNT